jgi:hypothetical protein
MERSILCACAWQVRTAHTRGKRSGRGRFLGKTALRWTPTIENMKSIRIDDLDSLASLYGRFSRSLRIFRGQVAISFLECFDSGNGSTSAAARVARAG